MENSEQIIKYWDFSQREEKRVTQNETTNSRKDLKKKGSISTTNINKRIQMTEQFKQRKKKKKKLKDYIPFPPLSFFLLLLNLLLAGYVAIYASGYASEKQTEAHVYDISHKILSHIKNISITFKQADMSVSISVISFIIWFLRGILLHKGTNIELRRYKVFEKWMFTYACVLWIRTISFSVTVIPDPDGACLAHIKNEKIDFLLPIRYALGQSYVCGDLIISGHVAATFSIVCAVDTRRLKIAAFINYFWTTFCVLLTKMHYTVDVVLASILVILISPYYDKFFSGKDEKPPPLVSNNEGEPVREKAPESETMLAVEEVIQD